MSNSQKAASPEQITANRANAARSTGPRTPAGKARSSQNARKHGFDARDFTVAGLEQAHDLDNLKADAVDFYQPENSQELYAVERIAITQLALLRISHLESQLFAGCLDGDVLLGEGFERSAANSNAFSLAMRYAAQAERQYRRAVDDFNRLKALRPELPNEPVSGTQPMRDCANLGVRIPARQTFQGAGQGPAREERRPDGTRGHFCLDPVSC